MIKSILLILVFMVIPALSGGEIRVISLSPALTDMVVELGGVGQLCGRSVSCNAPGTEKIPVAGSMGLPDVEKILLLRPDYVISDTRHPGGNWKTLFRQGIKVRFFPGEKLEDHPANLRELGRLLGRREKAEAAAVRFEQKIAELRGTLPEKSCRVLVVFSVPPVISCGKKSFINEALKLAGAENICSKTERSYFAVSAVHILKSAPEVIITAGVPEDLVRRYFQRPEFRMVPAVKQQRFISVDPDEFCRAGSRLPDAVRKLKLQLSRNAVSPGAASHSLR